MPRKKCEGYQCDEPATLRFNILEPEAAEVNPNPQDFCAYHAAQQAEAYCGWHWGFSIRRRRGVLTDYERARRDRNPG